MATRGLAVTGMLCYVLWNLLLKLLIASCGALLMVINCYSKEERSPFSEKRSNKFSLS